MAPRRTSVVPVSEYPTATDDQGAWRTQTSLVIDTEYRDQQKPAEPGQSRVPCVLRVRGGMGVCAPQVTRQGCRLLPVTPTTHTHAQLLSE